MFYPFAFSSVCTGELCEVRDSLPAFESDDVQLLAVSCDPMHALRAFAEQDGLTFPLLSDFWPHGEVAAAYGVFNEQRGCAERSTFIVDREGVLRWSVHNQMPDARDLEQQLKVLADL
jgi:mycoredoxin-dependent peroxiredoxin